MSRGPGTMQRLMLSLASHEVRVAEAAAERQRPYRSPVRWALADLIYSLSRQGELHEKVITRQRAKHEWFQEMLKRAQNGDEQAMELVQLWMNITASVYKPGPKLEEFIPSPPAYRDLHRFTRRGRFWGSAARPCPPRPFLPDRQSGTDPGGIVEAA